MIKVVDKSKDGIYSSNMELVDSFTDYSSKNLDFDKPVTIELLDDDENAKNPLGMTAYYSPEEMKVVVYVTGRHLKDILRSISHELIHHVQNCRGDLDHTDDTKLGYAQRDSHMRDMETEAYNCGNIMNFRDFEDIYKQGKHKMSKLKENRLQKLSNLLNEQAGYAAIIKALTGAGESVVEVDVSTSVPLEGRMKTAIAKCQREDKKFTRAIATDRGSVLGTAVVYICSTPESAGMSLAGPGGRSGVAQDGVVGQTMAKRTTASPAGRGRKRKCPKLPLSRGCTGRLVKTIQRMLIALGYNLGKAGADGDYGRRTKKAVEAFQKAEGLKVDGVAGKNTVKALKDVAVGTQAAFAKRAKDTATASPAGPDVPPAARPTRMTRVEAMRRAKEDIVPKLRRVRTRSFKRGLVRYLTIGLRELLDVQKMDPAKAYETLLSIFGRGGVKYITPTYSRDSAFPSEDRTQLSNAWKRGYENALNKTLEEL